MGLATAAIGLFHQENPDDSAALHPPWLDGGVGKYKGEPIFVLGGASAVGQFGRRSLDIRCSLLTTALSVIQLARLAGFSPIITTASSHNVDMLKAIGATHVIDRNLPTEKVLEEGKEAAGGAPIKTVYDAVSLADTQHIAYDALAPGGTLVLDLPSQIQEEKKVASKKVVNVFGSTNAPPNRKLGVALYAKLTEWLADGSIKVFVRSHIRFRWDTDQRVSFSRPVWKRYRTGCLVSPRGWRGFTKGSSAALS